MPPSKPLVAAAVCLVYACLASSTFAQVPPSASAQTNAQTTVPARITQAVDEMNLVTLKGNVHPLALAQYDQGAVSDGMPLHRMLLLLQRSSEQEASLQALLDAQQDKSSPHYHAWLTPQQFGAYGNSGGLVHDHCYG